MKSGRFSNDGNNAIAIGNQQLPNLLIKKMIITMRAHTISADLYGAPDAPNEMGGTIIVASNSSESRTVHRANFFKGETFSHQRLRELAMFAKRYPTQTSERIVPNNNLNY